MRQTLFGATLVAAVGFTIYTSLLVSRAFPPPDAPATVLGMVWLGSPFLAAALLAVAVRNHPAVLGALLLTVLLAGGASVVMYDGVVDAILQARHDAANALFPGEDPDRGPGGMRQSAANLGSATADVFGVAVLTIVPPVQATIVLIVASVGRALSAWRRRARQPVAD